MERALKIDLSGTQAAFLWGPRKVGKTTLLKLQFPNATYYDLLNSEIRTNLLIKPHLFREEVIAQKPRIVIVDEIQKVPALLDEIHWLLENSEIKFIMCGSSARKLRNEAVNLLGGRAWRFELFPLTSNEIVQFDLARALNHGLIPQHYLSEKPHRYFKGYIRDYLEQEINHEALTRNIPAFARFLDAVALTHGQLLNYSNVASDCGVSAKTVREYYQILKDTLLGHELEPWKKSKDRRMIETSKFYLFDPGIVKGLLGLTLVEEKTVQFGHFFEHFLLEEMRAYLSYSELDLPMCFWRTSTGLEVDLIIGQMMLAVEFKAVKSVGKRDLKGLLALLETHKVKHPTVVSLDEKYRKLSNGIEIMPGECSANIFGKENFLMG